MGFGPLRDFNLSTSRLNKTQKSVPVNACIPNPGAKALNQKTSMSEKESMAPQKRAEICRAQGLELRFRAHTYKHVNLTNLITLPKPCVKAHAFRVQGLRSRLQGAVVRGVHMDIIAALKWP